MTGKKLPLTSMPILSRGRRPASVAKPTVDVVNAASPSKLVLRSRMST